MFKYSRIRHTDLVEKIAKRQETELNMGITRRRKFFLVQSDGTCCFVYDEIPRASAGRQPEYKYTFDLTNSDSYDATLESLEINYRLFEKLD